MDTEQKDMYVNLPGELYSVISGVAIGRDVSIGTALETIISEWSKNTACPEEQLEPLVAKLDSIEAMVSHLSGGIADLPCWGENKDDSLNSTNLTARFDNLEVLIKNIAHKIDCLPCRS